MVGDRQDGTATAAPSDKKLGKITSTKAGSIYPTLRGRSPSLKWPDPKKSGRSPRKLQAPIGQIGQALYAGIGYGRVWGPQPVALVGTQLAGAVIGVKGTVLNAGSRSISLQYRRRAKGGTFVVNTEMQSSGAREPRSAAQRRHQPIDHRAQYGCWRM